MPLTKQINTERISKELKDAHRNGMYDDHFILLHDCLSQSRFHDLKRYVELMKNGYEATHNRHIVTSLDIMLIYLSGVDSSIYG